MGGFEFNCALEFPQFNWGKFILHVILSSGDISALGCSLLRSRL